MILEEIKENEKVVIVRFEPWNFSSTNQLLEQFFVHLANQFHWTKDKTLKEVGNALERYSDAFDFAESYSTDWWSDIFFGEKNF